MFKNITLEQLFNLPSQQVLVLTANNRLSVFIKSQYLEYDRQQYKVVSLPKITPYTAWLTQLSQQLSFYNPDMPLVLNETAQQWYWRQSLDRSLSEEQKKYFNIPAAAAMLSQAKHLQVEWDIDVKENEKNPEYEAFEQWLTLYQKTLQHLSAWDSDDLHKALPEVLSQEQISVPSHIVLAGFYSLSPYQKKLLQVFAARGTQLYTLRIHRKKAKTVHVYSAEDVEQELEGALQWVMSQASSSSAKVALVVPNLQQEAPRLQRIVSQTLRGTTLEHHWHIAVGRPLAEWGMVRSILRWFALIIAFRRPVPVKRVGEALLHAEFAFNASQRDALALWDVQLRESGQTMITFLSFYERLKQIAPERADTFKQAVEVGFEYKRRCADWVQLYRDTLAAFCFPGEQLSSINYQLCQAFEQALKGFSVLDEMLPSMDAEEALLLFRQYLMQRNFQAKRHAAVKLDIIGLYELEGGEWDAVWVLGVTDEVLPQRPSPNPYLPIRSQRRANVMHASPESEMRWAAQIFEAILHSAPTIALSYPKIKNDVVLRPSSLLRPYMSTACPLSIQVGPQQQTPQLEWIEDNRGLAKQGVLQGGYGLLEKQSRNPLWAYAVARLGLKALPAYASSDLTHFVRGNFLHKTMELFYAQLCSQDLLHNCVDVEQAVERSLTEASKLELRHIHSHTLKLLVIARTRELVKRFIAFDRDKRLPFDVFARESTYSFDAHGIYLNFKVDRIDKVNGEAWLFIDYKSGRIPTLKECYEYWIERERLINIQLPLYASILKITEHHKVEGISFASLARGKVFYEGLWQSEQYEKAKEESILDRDKWLSLNKQWQSKIDLLFAEIAIGEASNRYFQEGDMAYCEIYPFLRLHAINEEGVEE